MKGIALSVGYVPDAAKIHILKQILIFYKCRLVGQPSGF